MPIFIGRGAPFSVKVGHHGAHLVVTLDEIANCVVRPRDADLHWSNADLLNEKAKPLATKGWISASQAGLDGIGKLAKFGRVQHDWID